ncbi:MAG: hypothetical protein AABZ60_11465 [Planctomycetota bacterium]
MKSVFLILFCLLFIVASCAIIPGAQSTAQGIAHLVLSPIQIAAGILEGISTLPYYISTGVHELNHALIQAQTSITLEDTYDSVYETDIHLVGSDGNTNRVFTRLETATHYFHTLLKEQAIQNYEEYLLTSVTTANDKGYTLYAVVHRPQKNITVTDKLNSQITRTFDTQDRFFYEPYEKDIYGNPIDAVIDWVAMPRSLSTQQKQQAMMITIAANGVKEGKRRYDFWPIEQRWIAGEYLDIVNTQDALMRQKMGIQ